MGERLVRRRGRLSVQAPRVRQHGVQPITGNRSSSRHSCCTVFVKRLACNIGDRKVPRNVRLALEGGDNLVAKIRWQSDRSGIVPRCRSECVQRLVRHCPHDVVSPIQLEHVVSEMSLNDCATAGFDPNRSFVQTARRDRPDRNQSSCSRIHPATRSPIMMQVRFVFARGIVGITEASAIRRPKVPWTLPY